MKLFAVCIKITTMRIVGDKTCEEDMYVIAVNRKGGDRKEVVGRGGWMFDK